MADERKRQTRLTLIERLQKNPTDHDWERFQSFYWDVITGWARQRGCPPEQAADVYQETMISLLRYLPRFDPTKARFRTFLKTIANRRIEDAWRRHYKGPRDAEKRAQEDRRPLYATLEDLPDPNTPEVSGSESVWLAGVVREALRSTFARIDDTTYKSFCRNMLDARSVDSIADEFGIGRNAIYNHKNRCLNILCGEVMDILRDLGDDVLNGMAPDSPAAMANLKVALEAYLAERGDLRLTTAIVEVPPQLQRSVHEFSRLLHDHSPPYSDSPWFRVIQAEKSSWAAVTDGMRIGRRQDCTLALSGSGVSGVHATVDQTPAGWRISDAQSTHGLWLTGTRIESRLLLHGDQLQLGSVFLVFIPG